MKPTRRKFLQTGALALSGLTLGGCQKDEISRKGVRALFGSGDPSIFSVNTKASPSGLLTTFEGLCALVTPADDSALDCALLSVDGLSKLVPKKKFYTHFPTLIVPRDAILDGTTAQPVAADVNHAYFSLDKINLLIEPESASTNKLALNSSALVRNCPIETDLEDWNNFSWVLDFESEVYSGQLKEGWREDPVVQALVMLRTGEIEPENLDEDDKGGKEDLKKTRPWKVLDASTGKLKTRGLKEIVRHVMDGQSFRLTFTSRVDQSTKILLLGEGKTEIGVFQLPSYFMEHVGHLDDLMACYLLLKKGEEAFKGGAIPFVPEYDQLNTCGSGATSTCGCCPITRFVDPDW